MTARVAAAALAVAALTVTSVSQHHGPAPRTTHSTDECRHLPGTTGYDAGDPLSWPVCGPERWTLPTTLSILEKAAGS